MTSRIFARRALPQLLGGAVGAGVIAYGTRRSIIYLDDGTSRLTPAEQQFTTASKYPVPEGYSGPVFKLKVDYPNGLPQKTTSNATAQLPPMPGPERPLPGTDPTSDAPWLRYDFKKDPKAYSSIVKEYCWTGNVENNFNVWDNTVSCRCTFARAP